MKSFAIQALAISLFIYGCNTRAANVETQNVREIPVFKIQSKDTIVHQHYVADIQAVKNVEIRSRVTGFLESIHTEEGSFVKKGQLIFKLSNQELANNLNKAKAALQSAEAAAKLAELEANRVNMLVERKVIVPSELEIAYARLADAKAKVEEARANLSDAQTKIEYLSIRSPFTGWVDRFPIKPGSLIDEGTLLTTLSDVTEVFAYYNISENEYLQQFRTMSDKINGKTEATLILSDGSTYAHKGVVEAKEAEFSETTGTIAFRAKFPNPDGMLKHGASGKVQLTTRLQNKILIPQKAVMEIQDRSFVFLVDSNNTVRMQTIYPVLRMDDFLIIEGGVEEGDVIVYEGVQLVRDGHTISPKYIQH